MGKKSIRILFFIVVVAFFAGVVTSERSWAQGAEKSTPANGEDGWRFLIAPYVWVGGIQGTAEGKRSKTENINLTVGDAFDLINNIDFILRGRIEIVFLGREVYLLRRDCRANHFAEQELDGRKTVVVVKRY